MNLNDGAVLHLGVVEHVGPGVFRERRLLTEQGLVRVESLRLRLAVGTLSLKSSVDGSWFGHN